MSTCVSLLCQVTAPLPIASKSIPEVVQSVSEPGEVATAEHGRESDHQTGRDGLL